jgi:hypothetical protein
MFKFICKRQLLGHKNQVKEIKVGEDMHWKWDVIPKVEDSH